MLTRRGSTLAELLIALTLAAIVLGTAIRSLLQQQRTSRLVMRASDTDGQLRMAADLVESQLGVAVPAMGDISDPTDSSLTLRIPVAVGVVCASAGGTTVLSVADVEPAPTGAVFSPPSVGDSLWWYPGAGATWVGRRISAVTAGDLECGALRTRGAVLRLVLAGQDTLPTAAPGRVTRQARYDVYRGSDGSWQLGRRDWSDALQRFTAPQPIAGPFARPVRGGDGTAFRFFDVEEQELGSADAPRIARVRLALLGQGTGMVDGGSRREQVEIAVQGSGAR